MLHHILFKFHFFRIEEINYLNWKLEGLVNCFILQITEELWLQRYFFVIGETDFYSDWLFTVICQSIWMWDLFYLFNVVSIFL